MTDLAVRPGTETADDTAAPVTGGSQHRLREPGGRGGLFEVFRSRVIVRMLVKRDLKLKYRYSSIGFAWAFVKPSLQFCVYYFIIGQVLGLERRVENFAIYIFCGLCLLHFFTETLQSGARSIIKNRAIVKKIWLPREVFPIAGMLVAATRFIPSFVILMVGATVTGWYFTWIGLAAAISGFAIVVVWGVACGLLVAALNVYLREIQNFLEFFGFLTHWLTPMMKPWNLVVERVSGLGVFGTVIAAAYIYNPLCTAVELFHLAFWEPTVDFYFTLSPHLWTRAWVMFGAGLVFLMFAQWVFRRMQSSFAEEL